MEEMVKKVLIMLLWGGLVVGLSLPALAGRFVELHKLTASDAAAGDWFGISVAISGSTAIVGAVYDDDAGSWSGSAYLYNFSDPCNITEIKITASDAAADDRFGRSVAISGNTAIVGARLDDDACPGDPGCNSGSAYLYYLSDPCNITEIKITASDAAAGDQFGWSVAISGTTALVGASLNDDASENSGSAYLYDFSDPCNITEIKLTASDAALGDQFGYSVAISGTTAIVGAYKDDDAGGDSGSAYLYDFSDPNNIIETKLTASDAATGDFFGNSVAISGSTALVGAYRDDDAGGDSGSAYLFDVATGSQIAKLTASDAATGDFFGASVAISGSTALVGATGNDDVGSSSGSAYLYEFTDPNNIIETKLTASDAEAWDEFGDSVAFSGATAIVGARLDDDAGTSSGSAYLFGLCLFAPYGDLNKDCGVDFVDLGVLCDEWLFEELSVDVWPEGGDGFVNFLDWAIFADGWGDTYDIFDLVDFASEWLKRGVTVADIAPYGGDGIVNMADYAVLAENWLGGL
jgi:esterase/lipase superfamily enzyme